MIPAQTRRLKAIRNKNCRACPLHKTASTVCLPGDGNYRLPIVVLGEAPGKTEDQRGRPFIGMAGKLLRSELSRAGLNPNALWFTNTAKCYPAGTPTKSEAETCRDLYLRKEIKELDPVFILALGRTALQAVTAESKSTLAAGKLHPCLFHRSALVFATHHPAYILRKDSLKGEWRNDLETFAAWALLDLTGEVRYPFRMEGEAEEV